MKLFAIAFMGLGLMATSAMAEGDAAKGEQVFKKCMACHTATEKTNKVGPGLLGIVGRKAGSAEGYNYSEGAKAFAATGAVWDEATLDTYLKDPKALVVGTKMAFAGVKDDAERADLIAFLKSHPAQ